MVVAKHEQLNIPNPQTNPEGEARVSYSAYYASGERDDSPERSRQSIIRRLEESRSAQTGCLRVLNLGSGPQPLEREYADRESPPLNYVSVDIARLDQTQLQHDPHRHTQASGCALPFPDGTFDTAVSNLALDFMPPQARQELSRVLAPGAKVHLNLHDPSIIPPDNQERLVKHQRKLMQQTQHGRSPNLEEQLKLDKLRFHQHLQENQLLFQSPQQIEATFSRDGFEVRRIDSARDERSNKWWEVDLVKEG